MFMQLNQTYIGIFTGAMIGLFFGGPTGAMIGGILAYYLSRHIDGVTNRPRGWHGTVQAVFFRTTFKTLGYLAKADGHVSEREIATARNIMRHLGLNEQSKIQAIKFFNEGKSPNFNLDHTIREFKLCCWYKPMLYSVFMDFLTQMATTDSGPNQQAILGKIARQLGVTYSGHQYQQNRSSGTNYYSTNSVANDYKLLNIDKTANRAEVKKAYRRAMNANHPDKLIAKGVPEEMIKLATEKTQKIKEAYERICVARGFKK
jgi:DnaJ like chaperone protein